jgi:hypothetical protein
VQEEFAANKAEAATEVKSLMEKRQTLQANLQKGEVRWLAR